MDKKIVRNALFTTAALHFTQAHAAATDLDYETKRLQLLKYTQEVVDNECHYVESFDFNAYNWADYEVVALKVILDDIENHTANYCKPPELTGMHQAVRAHPHEDDDDDDDDESGE